jgi:hypothetical protein
MHLILDTNVYASDFRMQGVSFSNLFGYVRRTKSTIVLPRLVREETVATYQRRLKSQLKAADEEWRKYRHLVLDRDIQPFPKVDIDREKRALRKRLRRPEKDIDLKNLVETEGVDLTEVFLRGIHRTRPANDDGEELRDVILWLFAIAYAKTIDEPLAFISSDRGFWHGTSHVAAQIEKDISESGRKITLYRTLDAFIADTALHSVDFTEVRFNEIFSASDLRAKLLAAVKTTIGGASRGFLWTGSEEGELQLTSVTFQGGSEYEVGDEVSFAEIEMALNLKQPVISRQNAGNLVNYNSLLFGLQPAPAYDATLGAGLFGTP